MNNAIIIIILIDSRQIQHILIFSEYNHIYFKRKYLVTTSMFSQNILIQFYLQVFVEYMRKISNKLVVKQEISLDEILEYMCKPVINLKPWIQSMLDQVHHLLSISIRCIPTSSRMPVINAQDMKNWDTYSTDARECPPRNTI